MKNENMKILLALVVAVFASLPSVAVAQWKPTSGPTGTSILATGVAGNVLLAATEDIDGVYRSTDSGLSWSRVSLNPIPNLVNQIFSFAQIGRYTLAGSGEFIFRSTDSGVTWMYSDTQHFGGARLDPFAVVRGSVFVISNFNDESAIYRSTDSGATWTWIKQNLGYYARIFEMCVVDTQLVISTDSGFYFLDDRAALWRPMPRGLTSLGGPICSFGKYLFAGGGVGIDRTSDLGKTWTICDSVNGDFFSTFYADNSGIYCVRSNNLIFHSSDTGNTWYEADNGITARFVRSIQSRNSILIAATDVGVFLSSNNGRNWVLSNNGMPEPEISSLIVTDSQLFAANPESGAFYSGDNGNHWRYASSAQGATRFSAVVQAGTAVLLGSQFAIFQTQDQGSTWSVQPNELQVASFGIRNGTLLAGCYNSVIRSTDSGTTWSDTAIFSVPNVGHNTANGFAFSGSITYCASDFGVGISKDDGRTWSVIPLDPKQIRVMSVAADQFAVYAATQRGVYRSTDHGENWIRVDGSFSYRYSDTNVFSLIIVDSNLFASTNYDVMVSRDHGMNWVSVGAGLSATVETFAESHGELFAGTTHGVWHRTLSEMIGQADVASETRRSNSILCYPNPFGSVTTIELNSDVASHVVITIVNSLGVEVARVANGEVKPGLNSFQWHTPIGLPVGAYQCLARLQTGEVLSAGIIVE